jgi:thioredoxin-dependent peroxiredoxin
MEKMAVIKEGQKAPDFKTPDQAGNEVALKDFKGKSVVLYFYPRDNTPGCTVEACGFRDGIKKFESADTVVLGVSPDSPASHQKFIGKFKLPFTLLSDEDKALCKSYGVWVKKKLYGKEYMGVARTTFVINKKGNIQKVFEGVKPDGHTEEVLQALKSS